MSLVAYCVQPFWRQNGRFAGGSTYRFKGRDEALRRAERLAIKNCGVLVYEQDEEYDVGPVGAPRLVARLGELPALAF